MQLSPSKSGDLLFVCFYFNYNLHPLLTVFTLLCFPQQVNGTTVNLPITLSSSVSVHKSGKYYTVSMTFGVTVRYDGNHYMEIKIIKE